MAEAVLGLGSGQAASLNQDLIDRLKEAERKATVEPIETNLTNWDTEKEKITEIKTKVNSLLEAIKPFDLFVSGGVTAFDEKSATASGEAVVFDAADETALNTGTTNVTITTLAKRDVFQSDAVNGATKDAALNAGDLNIAIGTNNYTIDTTDKTYQQIVDEINTYSKLSASIETVGDDSYRLVIKSADTGTANALTITGAASQTLGYTTDGTTEKAGSNIQQATNLDATVNGIAYDVSSNVITVDGGLKITAVKEGDSSITVQKSTTNVETKMNEFITQYNELVDLVDGELYSAESKINDKSTLRTMMSQIKDMLFGTYGTSDDKNIFNFGFSVNETTGKLSLDSSTFNEAVTNDLASLKELFVGVAEKEGLGTQLKTYVDGLDSSDGLLTAYEDNMDVRKTALEEDKEAAVEDLDNKYKQMAQQFADYGVIINQMEQSFSGLKLLIQQSTS